MRFNLFNEVTSALDEAVVKLDKAIMVATAFESTDDFERMSEKKRDYFVKAIYRAVSLSYRCRLLKDADSTSIKDKKILIEGCDKQSALLPKLLIA